MKKLLLYIAIGYMVIYFYMKTTYSNVIEKLAAAIQQMEGYYPGSRAYRNNNPGNLRFANQAGAIGQDESGFAIFPDYQTGYDALKKQLSYAFSGISKIYNIYMTLYEFFQKYDPTNSIAYAQFVAEKLGVSPDTQLKDLT